ncbi:MAG TPA: hypothetical protein VKQ72_09640 [Aggregatilineales bacterium]|nr:hypothetical protein [Aggregatilineales bacterium]
MSNDQVQAVFQILANLVLILAGGSLVFGAGLLVAIVSLVRAARNDKALESAIEKLYQSVPVSVQGTIKEVGDLATNVGGLIGDITAPPQSS